MDRLRVTNDTDETIEIEPGDSIDIFGDRETVKLMAARSTRFTVKTLERE